MMPASLLHYIMLQFVVNFMMRLSRAVHVEVRGA
jgi:hypothetical protein